MRKALMAALTIAAATIAPGCESASPTSRMPGQTAWHEPAISKEAALVAAEGALRERFRIASHDVARGVIRSAPLETVDPQAGPRVGDALGAPRRVRRVAEIQVTEGGDGVDLLCKVTVEEYDSDAHQLFRREHSLSDAPSDTPADRGEAATTEQTAVWRLSGRDKRMENSLRRSIEERMSRSAVEPASTPGMGG